MWNRRGKDQIWRIIRYKVDLRYYARCDCGYEFDCSVDVLTPEGWRISKTEFATTRYCPNCGARKRLITEVQELDEYPPYMKREVLE